LVRQRRVKGYRSHTLTSPWDGAKLIQPPFSSHRVVQTTGSVKLGWRDLQRRFPPVGKRRTTYHSTDTGTQSLQTTIYLSECTPHFSSLLSGLTQYRTAARAEHSTPTIPPCLMFFVGRGVSSSLLRCMIGATPLGGVLYNLDDYYPRCRVGTIHLLCVSLRSDR